MPCNKCLTGLTEQAVFWGRLLSDMLHCLAGTVVCTSAHACSHNEARLLERPTTRKYRLEHNHKCEQAAAVLLLQHAAVCGAGNAEAALSVVSSM